MLKKLIVSSIFMASLAWAGQAQALAIGTDAVRILDEGMFNISLQNNLSRSTALVFGAGTRGEGIIIDGMFKAYTGRMYQGINLQLGGTLETAGGGNNDIGLVAAVGWETSPARNFVFYGATKVILFTDQSGAQWRPGLGMMFVF